MPQNVRVGSSDVSLTVVPGGGGGGAGTATQVTQNGITFTFNQAYPVGQFVNGDWWVTPTSPGGSVVITGHTPATTGSGTTLQNGLMVNPTGTSQAYDGRASGFSATASGANPALPYTAVAGQSIIKTVSLATPVASGTANAGVIDKAVILTVLDAAPPANAFRPPYHGTSKPIFTKAQLNTALLPSLAAPVGAGGPTLAQVEGRYQQPQIDHCWATNAPRPCPVQSFHAFNSTATPHIYGENISIDNCEAILRTFLNDSLAAKLNSVIYLVQAGIDWYGVALDVAVATTGGGGHQGGRKIVVAYAGWLLGDAGVQAVANETAGKGFGEKRQFYWSATAGGTTSHFTGQSAGMALFGYLDAAAGKPWPVTAAGGGAKDAPDPLKFVDGGLTITPDGSAPNESSATYTGGKYIDITSSHAILASTICGVVKQQMGDSTLRTIFNNDTEIFYADRLWDFGLWVQPDGSPTRDLGAPARALHGTLKNGAIIAAGFGSAFGNAMRTNYYTVSTFTG